MSTMIALILFIAFGLFFGYFSTLNTSLVSIHFGTFSVTHIPMYALVLSSFAVGVLFTSLFYFIKYLSMHMAVRKKDHELEESNRKAGDLTKKIHQLELENTKLNSKHGQADNEDEVESI